MSGIYVAAESWLNDAATNDTRGKVLSAYMMAQTLGIIGAQGLLMLGDAGTSVLFIGASILVSVSFAPILLSAAVVPAVEVSKPMSLWALLKISPLGTVGIFFIGVCLCHAIRHGGCFRQPSRAFCKQHRSVCCHVVCWRSGDAVPNWVVV
ncbi:hypothetical protein N5P32_00115 [Marinomonas pontica]|uniref:hypothetical protein n=1 Tax=Marinomonas pontica TaxID=264739 RepID=UPI002243C742|nr:hypothetical protein [Marinomonas pontica]MCW8354400.1 hypothetical protein [Marinomonas pontica]